MWLFSSSFNCVLLLYRSSLFPLKIVLVPGRNVLRFSEVPFLVRLCSKSGLIRNVSDVDGEVSSL